MNPLVIIIITSEQAPLLYCGFKKKKCLLKKKHAFNTTGELELIKRIQLSDNLLAQESVPGDSSLRIGLLWVRGRQKV